MIATTHLMKATLPQIDRLISVFSESGFISHESGEIILDIETYKGENRLGEIAECLGLKEENLPSQGWLFCHR